MGIFIGSKLTTSKLTIGLLDSCKWSVSLSLDPSSLFEAHSFPYLTTSVRTLSKLHSFKTHKWVVRFKSSGLGLHLFWPRILTMEKDLCPESYYDGEARCCACLDKTHSKRCKGVQDESHSQRVGATCGLY
jgi:hypothetical protein